ncbi:hypothetical protein PMI07_005046 [Rhizobium sp. CF080]|nr:hypothetical protein PMI07_005046 [Rhizobium sp. CF080]
MTANSPDKPIVAPSRRAIETFCNPCKFDPLILKDVK